EEGYRRPQDAILGIQGLRDEQEHQSELARKHEAVARHGGQVSIACADAAAGGEPQQVEALFRALAEARRHSGEKSSADLDSFKKFVRQKTSQIRQQYGCQAVEYSVELNGGRSKI